MLWLNYFITYQYHIDFQGCLFSCQYNGKPTARYTGSNDVTDSADGHGFTYFCVINVQTWRMYKANIEDPHQPALMQAGNNLHLNADFALPSIHVTDYKLYYQPSV